ncbi:MAG: hypothetical protein A2Z18_03525 [Armatimonadetes bacterium RBG_16_58_9]|nr:MAG: hypothetical protein A2Z18_03525 [Armatimonadetes bacterium RBG_16_58_9]
MRRRLDVFRSYPDEAFLVEAQRVAGLVGKPVLTSGDFTKHSGIPASIVRRRFGSWRVLLERAGLEDMYSAEAGGAPLATRFVYSDEELLEEVRRVAELAGKPVLLQKDFREYSRIAPGIFRQRFGGWRAVLEQAGVGHAYSGGQGVRYSDKELLEEVRRVAELAGKTVLTQENFQDQSRISLATLSRRFGSWRAVLEQAGVGHAYSGATAARYSDEELLEEVRRAVELAGKPVLMQQEFQKYSEVSHGTLTYRFGKWRAVLERAGVGHAYCGKPSKKHSDEELLEEVRRAAELVGKPVLTQKDFRKYSAISCNTLKDRFGKWRAVLERAGVGHLCSRMVDVRPPVRYSDEELLAEVRRAVKLARKPVLTTRDFRKYSGISVGAAKARFGNWRAVLERAGMGHAHCSTTNSKKYSDEELLEKVRRAAELVGKPVLTEKDFHEHSGIRVSTLKHRFGKWRAVLERAGVGHLCSRMVDVHAPVSYSDEELLAEVRRAVKLARKPVLTTRDFYKYSGIAVATLTQRFGAWPAVLQRAGVGNAYSGGRGVRYRDRELLDEVRRVAELVGKSVLSARDFRKYSRIRLSTLQRRLGDWPDVLDRAGVGHMCTHKATINYQRSSDINQQSG